MVKKEQSLSGSEIDEIRALGSILRGLGNITQGRTSRCNLEESVKEILEIVEKRIQVIYREEAKTGEQKP